MSDVQQRGKCPRTGLAGPYGHPFHPILVTVPIGAWVASFAFDLGSQWAGEAAVFAKGAFWLIVAGVIGALAAAVFGLLDLLVIPRGTKAFRTGVTHMILNLLVVALYVVNLVVRRDELGNGSVELLPIALSAAALALLGVSGWFGGELTYRYGVRVVDEGTQADGYR